MENQTTKREAPEAAVLPTHFVSAEESHRQTEDLHSQRSELSALMKEWEELSQTLEAAN